MEYKQQKLAVVTVRVDSNNQAIYRSISALTHPTIKRYAEKIGADFIIIKDSIVKGPSPHWEKFQIQSIFNDYDRVIYFDTDIIIRDDCPNLFELVPTSKIGMFNEGAFADRREAMLDAANAFNLKPEGFKGQYYNTGVIVASRQHRAVFTPPEIFKNVKYWEQSYFNLMMLKEQVSVYELDYHFNRCMIMNKETGEDPCAAYVIHYAGVLDLNTMLIMIQHDIYNWNLNKSKGYKFKRNIVIDVGGGLGDQICAEPVIRFMLCNSYKDELLHIITDYPEIFRHLDVKTYKRESSIVNYIYNCKQEDNYRRLITETNIVKSLRPFKLLTAVPPNHNTREKAEQILLNSRMNIVDFISITLLGGTLPDRQKRIHLPLKEEDFEVFKYIAPNLDLGSLVLIHPGKAWETKTIPAEWWLDLIKKLQEQSKTVGIIGSFMFDEKGYSKGCLDFKVPWEGTYDFRNQLSIMETAALISKARTLITNDSAPAHIANAYNNQIVLLPTVKHPDTILMARETIDKYENSVALWKRLHCDDIDFSRTYSGSDTPMMGFFRPGKNIYDYIPDAGAVAMVNYE